MPLRIQEPSDLICRVVLGYRSQESWGNFRVSRQSRGSALQQAASSGGVWSLGLLCLHAEGSGLWVSGLD